MTTFALVAKVDSRKIGISVFSECDTTVLLMRIARTPALAKKYCLPSSSCIGFATPVYEILYFVKS